MVPPGVFPDFPIEVLGFEAPNAARSVSEVVGTRQVGMGLMPCEAHAKRGSVTKGRTSCERASADDLRDDSGPAKNGFCWLTACYPGASLVLFTWGFLAPRLGRRELESASGE